MQTLTHVTTENIEKLMEELSSGNSWILLQVISNLDEADATTLCLEILVELQDAATPTSVQSQG